MKRRHYIFLKIQEKTYQKNLLNFSETLSARKICLIGHHTKTQVYKKNSWSWSQYKKQKWELIDLQSSLIRLQISGYGLSAQNRKWIEFSWNLHPWYLLLKIVFSLLEQ